MCWIPDEERHHELCLLAQNVTGYRNLMLLLSRSYQQGQYLGRPRVKQAWVREHSEGLIALSGGRQGDIGQALLNGREDDARAALTEWRRCFSDRFYLELQRTGRAGGGGLHPRRRGIGDGMQLPVVATNDVRFLEADEFEAHEARVCIGDGRTLDDPRRLGPTPISNTCALLKRWRSCSPTYPRRLKIRWKSPGVARCL